MKEYVTSDLHFGHANIIEYENRPFKDVEQMNNYLIEIWNEKVKVDDIVYILGDFSWYNGRKTNEILEKLNGQKILIRGNHDSNFLKDNKFNKELFKEITEYKEIKRNKTKIIMCHYPIIEWNAKDNGSIHLFGHLHSKDNLAQRVMQGLLMQGYKCLNVGIDLHTTLIDLDEIVNEEVSSNDGQEDRKN